MRKEGARVVVAEDILINPRVILKAGTPLRAVYLPPDAEDPDVRKLQRKKEMNDTFSRTMWKPVDTGPTPKQQAAYDRMMNTIWDEPMQFQAAFARLQRSRSKLVFEDSGGKVELEPVELVEGMLIARAGETLRILCVEEDSKAERAGLQAGNELITVNGQTLGGDLALFQKLYQEVKNGSGTSASGRRIELTFRDASGQTHTAALSMPISLQTDLWSEIDTAKPTGAPTSTPVDAHAKSPQDLTGSANNPDISD